MKQFSSLSFIINFRKKCNKYIDCVMHISLLTTFEMKLKIIIFKSEYNKENRYCTFIQKKKTLSNKNFKRILFIIKICVSVLSKVYLISRINKIQHKTYFRNIKCAVESRYNECRFNEFSNLISIISTF